MGEANLDDDFRELFVALNLAKVSYLMIGGYAVNFYGHHRATKDIDVWIAADAENASRVSEALVKWGGFSASRVAPKLFVEPDKVFVMGRPPTRIDLLTGAPGLNFEACWQRRNLAAPQCRHDGWRGGPGDFARRPTDKQASCRPTEGSCRCRNTVRDREQTHR